MTLNGIAVGNPCKNALLFVATFITAETCSRITVSGALPATAFLGASERIGSGTKNQRSTALNKDGTDTTKNGHLHP